MQIVVNRNNIKRIVRLVELLKLPELKDDERYYVDGLVITVPDKIIIQMTTLGARVVIFEPDNNMTTCEVNNLEVRGIMLAIATSNEVIRYAAIDVIRHICHNGIPEFEQIPDDDWSDALIIVQDKLLVIKFIDIKSLCIYINSGLVIRHGIEYVLTDEFMSDKEGVLNKLRGYVHLLS